MRKGNKTFICTGSLILLLIMNLSQVTALTYMDVQENILAEQPTHITFTNLVEENWYFLNWTDNSQGQTFRYYPILHSQTLEITVTNPNQLLSCTFYLYHNENHSLITSEIVFWDEEYIKTHGPGFVLPDVIGFLLELPWGVYAAIPILIIIWLIFSHMFRRGR